MKNLITNAYHALPGESGLIEVSLESISEQSLDNPSIISPDSGKFIRLRVQDNGAGMSPEVRDRIFELFFSTKPVGKGTGLGLSTVHGIVTALGGVIEVESAPGQGTVIAVALPQSGQEELLAAESSVAEKRGNGQHILLVDDEPAILAMLEEMLVRSGYRVSALGAPESALEAFSASPDGFSVLLTDFAMPKMTGVQLATEIHKLRPALPVLLMTGYGESITEKVRANAGILQMLLKPLRARALKTVPAEACGMMG